jgi:FkbM family methyltransferase
LASLAYRIIGAGRSMIGEPDRATVRRGGMLWQLDLSEGIDFSIYLLGAFERSTAATLRKLVREGDTVFDIGANVGAHTLGLARSVGPPGCVYAFEPTDFAFAKLKRNLALNPELETRVRPHQILFAGEPTAPRTPELYASWPLKKGAPVHPKHRGRLATTMCASVDTLDHFVEREAISRLHLIKIDVDGHEYPVLKGGLNTLARFRPILVMEMSPYVHDEASHGFRCLVALLQEAGYSLQEAGSWKSLPLQAEELERLVPDGAGINVVARATGHGQE